MAGTKGSENSEQPKVPTSADLATMSDEELEKLTSNPPIEGEAKEEPPENSDKGSETNLNEGEKKEDEGGEPSDNPEKGTDSTPENSDKVEKDPKKELARVKKELEHLRKLHGRASNELGELRKRLREKPTAEDYDQDPVAASEALQEHHKVKAEIDQKEREVQMREILLQNMELISNHAPDLQSNRDIIREIMAEVDQVEDSQVSQLMENIYLQNPWGVYHLNERAKLYKENKNLKKELEQLKAQLKEAPEKTAKQISKVSRMKSNVNASTATPLSGQTKPVASAHLASMSDEELENFLQSQQKGT